MDRIGFGGGCHWCTEAVFHGVKGVSSVEQGYISSHPPHEGFSEAVIVHFDRTVIELSILIGIHLQSHRSASAHGMRKKYRSAIYTFSQVQKQEAIKILESMQKEYSDKIITEVLSFQKFEPSAEKYLNYFIKDPGKPFCRTYISPKLKFLEEKYPDIYIN